MEKYKQFVIASIFFSIIGVSLVAYGASIDIPSRYKTFLGIPYATNPEYATNFASKLITFFAGIVCLGIGLGILIPLYDFYKMEKSKLVSATYSISCGTKSPFNANFCQKCGEKLGKST